MEKIINHICIILLKTLKHIAANKKKISFWLWIILFVFLYKNTYLFLILILILWFKLARAVITKKLIVKFKFFDLIIWNYLISAQKINKDKIIAIFAIFFINFLLTISIGLLNTWLELYEIAVMLWKNNRMRHKKINTYPSFIKDCLKTYKEKYTLTLDTSIKEIFKINIKYDIKFPD